MTNIVSVPTVSRSLRISTTFGRRFVTRINAYSKCAFLKYRILTRCTYSHRATQISHVTCASIFNRARPHLTPCRLCAERSEVLKEGIKGFVNFGKGTNDEWENLALFLKFSEDRARATITWEFVKLLVGILRDLG